MKYLISKKDLGNVKAAILASPYLKYKQRLSPVDYFLSKILNVLYPRYKSTSDKDFVQNLTHSEEEKKKIREDKKCFRHATVRWYNEAKKAQEDVAKQAKEVNLPTHVSLPLYSPTKGN